MHVQQAAATALEAMFSAASADGVELRLDSGYRSYTEQTSLYNYYVNVQGQATADEQSARPGHSEHQTGLAVDIGNADATCSVQQCFADTPGGKWLAANAYKYGFLLRYTDAKTAITGFAGEPWHFRYIGKQLAEEMRRKNILTLEEYFKLPAAPDYK
jgi:D-alanyl-D-alanine carboxypeptidase